MESTAKEQLKKISERIKEIKEKIVVVCRRAPSTRPLALLNDLYEYKQSLFSVPGNTAQMSPKLGSLIRDLMREKKWYDKFEIDTVMSQPQQKSLIKRWMKIAIDKYKKKLMKKSDQQTDDYNMKEWVVLNNNLAKEKKKKYELIIAHPELQKKKEKKGTKKPSYDGPWATEYYNSPPKKTQRPSKPPLAPGSMQKPRTTSGRRTAGG